MTVTTPLEKEIVLKLFKDFSSDYNPSSIAKALGKSRVGTFKALNSLESDSIVKGKTLGKARFYKINLGDEYARKNVETLLMEEAKKYSRWKDELNELFKFIDVVILFGSVIRNEDKANDIDILIVFDKKNNSSINTFLNEKNQLLIKKLHPIKQTKEDIIKNIKKQDKVVVSAIKEGVVLRGYEKIIEMIRNVTGE
jgi:predicted nucleotidyltransferase